MEEKSYHIPPLVRWWVLAACLIGLWAVEARALGTPAGTPITSTATVSYMLGADPSLLTVTASNIFNVQEVIDLSLVWQDAARIAVNTPHADRVLTFFLTNTGNGPEDFRLTADETLAGDQFNPGVQSIWIESNGIENVQADDTPYDAAGVALPADHSVLVYVTSTIPSGLADGDLGSVQLTAAAQTAGAAGQAPGTLLTGAGYNSVDAVVGTTGAEVNATGAYEVAAVSVVVSKSIVRISDPFGGQRPYTGARVTYRIAVEISGSGTAQALVISDLIPAGMTYAEGSMVLDGTPQSDAADGDPGDFNLTAAGTVTVQLNDTAAPAAHSIEFDTTIN